MSTYTELLNNLDRLELTKVKELLPSYMDSSIQANKSFTDLLKELTDAEVDFREERARLVNLTLYKRIVKLSRED